MISIAQPNTQSEQLAIGRIPLSEPTLTGREWEYVRECLETNWLSTAGPFVSRLETMVADRLGVTSAIATSCGTSALHVALQVAGVQPGHEVIAPSLTFIASINAIRYAGAFPILIGSETDTAQLSIESCAEFVRTRCTQRNGKLVNLRTGRRVSAIMPVHILGHPCDLDPLLELALENNLAVVEDACEALGARYKEREIGSRGDITCFSFNGNKTITAGAGGMIVTDRPEWGERARHLTTQAKEDGPEFIHNEIGFNYRQSNLHAAVGCAQFEALDEYIGKKRRIAARYSSELRIDGLSHLEEATWAYRTAWLSAIRINEKRFGMSSRDLQSVLRLSGIESRPLWQPAHASKPHRDAEVFECCASETLYHEVLCLPSSVGLTDDEQGRVIESIEEAR